MTKSLLYGGVDELRLKALEGGKVYGWKQWLFGTIFHGHAYKCVRFFLTINMIYEPLISGFSTYSRRWTGAFVGIHLLA